MSTRLSTVTTPWSEINGEQGGTFLLLPVVLFGVSCLFYISKQKGKEFSIHNE